MTASSTSAGDARGKVGVVVGLLVVLFPALLMGFALSMDRVETRLRRLGEAGDVVVEDTVEQFLEQASASEVDTFLRDGLPHALQDQQRRRDGSTRTPAPGPSRVR